MKLNRACKTRHLPDMSHSPRPKALEESHGCLSQSERRRLCASTMLACYLEIRQGILLLSLLELIERLNIEIEGRTRL
jgi:hypothetical protein